MQESPCTPTSLPLGEERYGGWFRILRKFPGELRERPNPSNLTIESKESRSRPKVIADRVGDGLFINSPEKNVKPQKKINGWEEAIQEIFDHFVVSFDRDHCLE